MRLNTCSLESHTNREPSQFQIGNGGLDGHRGQIICGYWAKKSWEKPGAEAPLRHFPQRIREKSRLDHRGDFTGRCHTTLKGEKSQTLILSLGTGVDGNAMNSTGEAVAWDGPGPADEQT